MAKGGLEPPRSRERQPLKLVRSVADVTSEPVRAHLVDVLRVATRVSRSQRGGQSRQTVNLNPTIGVRPAVSGARRPASTAQVFKSPAIRILTCSEVRFAPETTTQPTRPLVASRSPPAG